MTIPKWLDWAQRLQAIAQSGLSYDPSVFDRERYEQVAQIAAEMIMTGANGQPADVASMLDIFAAQVGHATPKIDVRGVIFREDKLLLVQEKMDESRWTLPGGWADIGESPSESVVREIHEETGFDARPLKLLALADRNKHDHPPSLFHAYKAFIRCELISDERRFDHNNFETGDIGWFTLSEIESLDLSLARVTVGQYRLFFEHLHNPQRMTDFD